MAEISAPQTLLSFGEAQVFVQKLWDEEGEILRTGVRQKCDHCDGVCQQSHMPLIRYPSSYAGNCVICGRKLRNCPCF